MNQQMDFLTERREVAPDICGNRCRHNANSRAANARIAPMKKEQRERVLVAVAAAGSAGITCKELAEQWGVGMNHISGRFSELKAERPCRVLVVGRRDGCAVYRALQIDE